MLRAAALSLLALTSCSQVADAPGKRTFEIEKKTVNGPVAIVLRVEKKDVTIIDRIHLEIEAIAQEGWKVELPALDDKLKTMEVVDYGSIGPEAVGDNIIREGKWYDLEPFFSGEHTIPALEIEFVKLDDERSAKRTVETEEITLTVKPLTGVDGNKPGQFNPIAGVVSIPPPSGWWIVLAIFIIAALAAGVYLLIKRRRQAHEAMVPEPEAAHVRAYRRLQALVAKNLTGQGLIKEYYVELSDIIRRYIEDRFGLRAPERTTEEFFIEVAAGKKIGTGQTDLLEEFLTHCDLVKFARHQPDRDEARESFDLAKTFIDKTRAGP